MQLHQITPTTKQKQRKRIGRGGKRGTYSGRGVKGQKSRAGARIRPAFRDILKQLPKKRGFRFKPVSEKPAVVNLDKLEKKFKSGEVVSPKTLLEKGLISRIKGRVPTIKILGKGELKKKLQFKDVEMSESVKDRIRKVGSSVK